MTEARTTTGPDPTVFDPGPVTTRLAIFDLDRTLVPGSSLAPLARLLADAGVISRRRLVGAAVQHARFVARGASDVDVERLRTEALSVVAGLDRAVLLPLTVTVGARVAGTATAAARLLVQLHRERGDFCVVLSASPQELVEVVGGSTSAPTDPSAPVVRSSTVASPAGSTVRSATARESCSGSSRHSGRST